MSDIAGTIRGVNLLTRTHSGRDAREVWQVTADFAAYTGSGDTASLDGIGAAINATARDGKARTLRGALPGPCGSDTDAQDVYFTGASVQALTVSSDNLEGNLSNAAGTELTSATASSGVQVIVIVDAA